MQYKFILLLFLFFTTGLYYHNTQAQGKQGTIIDDLETFVPGNGIIQIISDPRITELIGIRSSNKSSNEKSYVKTGGYRIQVFMSNDSQTAKKEISDKGNLIKSVFPDIPTYPWYVAPNWKLLVGDFRTKEEADAFKQKLLKSIPELGKEMYVIANKVNIPAQNGK